MKHLKAYGLSNEVISKFELYSNMLLEWNDKFNLTAIKDPEQIEIKHFIDSLISEKYISYSGKTLLDVGSGAGFPGIPLAICHPDLKVTLLESNGKKVMFLKEVVNALSLQNVTVIQARSEEVKDLKESFDFVTARAVKQLNILLEICSHLLKNCGEFVAYKGSDGEQELADSKHAISVLGLELESINEYTLPELNDKRTLIVLKKVKKAQKKYPRMYSEIVKSPL